MITLVFGRREQGKSTLAYHLALARDTRVIYDPRAMFHTTSDVLPDSTMLEELLDERSEVIIQPEYHVRENFSNTTQALWSWVRYWRNMPETELSLAFLIDEARLVDTPTFIPDGLDALLRFAPRSQVDIIFTAHRPSDVATDVRAIADFWILFQITQEHDLKVIEARAGTEVAAKVKELPEHHALLWNDSKATYRVVDKPEIWKHDIAALPKNVRNEGELAWQQLSNQP